MKMTIDELKAKIIAGVYENHAGKITGYALQTILLDMVDSLSTVGPIPVPVFEISEFAVSPLTMTPGTEITISGKITNTGAAAGACTVKIELKNNTTVIAEKAITIPTIQPGGIYNLSEKLPTTGMANGTYTLFVTAPGISKTQNIVIAPADIFQISGVVVRQKSEFVKAIPVPGVKIQIKGTSSSDTTDAQGKYVTEPKTTKPANTGTLTLSYNNIVIREEPINNRSVINFTVNLSGNSILDSINDIITALKKLKVDSAAAFKKYTQLNDYINKIDRELLATGKMNDEILAQFRAVGETIIEVVIKLVQSGAVPDKDDLLRIGLIILDADLTVYLGAIVEADVDIATGSATYKYIGTTVKKLVRAVDPVAEKSFLAEYKTILELAADKEILAKLLGALR
jgi:hypothetical protein